MKVKIIILLIVFAITICAPFKINAHYNTGNKTTSILTLDVCQAAGASLSAQGDIPCVLGCPCTLSLFESGSKYAAANSVFNPFLLPFQQERPPKA